MVDNGLTQSIELDMQVRPLYSHYHYHYYCGQLTDAKSIEHRHRRPHHHQGEVRPPILLFEAPID